MALESSTRRGSAEKTPARGSNDRAADKPPARAESMGGLAKGLQIIEAFGPTRPELSITDAARSVGITPAAARRCLLTLEDLGYVSFDGKYYRPTPRMARLGASFYSTSPISALAQPCLVAVRDAIGESASLAVLDGDQVTFIARAESTHVVTMNVRLGAHLPAAVSATGRVLLASLSDERIGDMLTRTTATPTTPNTVVDRDKVWARIVKIREQGYELTDEELEQGLRSMAVPVTDDSGITHAAMSVAALASRAPSAEMREQFLPILTREARRLGRML